MRLDCRTNNKEENGKKCLFTFSKGKGMASFLILQHSCIIFFHLRYQIKMRRRCFCMQRNILSAFLISLPAFAGFAQTNAPTGSFVYDLDHPVSTFELPAVLKEISGIVSDAEGKSILAIQDEQGIVYWLNSQTGQIEKEIAFEPDGDFEDITLAGNTILAVKSSGSLFLLENCGKSTPIANKIKTGLEKTNNIEGATFDKKRNLLLLACKGNAGLGALQQPDMRAVYGFDLGSKTLLPEPVYTISRQDIVQFLSANKGIARWEKLNGLFTADKTEFGFCPSAIALHPNGDVYMLSSVGKMLLVLNPQGQIKQLVKLEKEVHPQPEGIFFDAKGALYICNEGKEGPALIHRFEN